MTAPTCATCRWWAFSPALSPHPLSFKSAVAVGKCRRFPPITGTWPNTAENDYCGEHTPKGEG